MRIAKLKPSLTKLTCIVPNSRCSLDSSDSPIILMVQWHNQAPSSFGIMHKAQAWVPTSLPGLPGAWWP